MDNNQGRSDKNIESSAYIVGLAFVGMACIFLWIGVVALLRLLGWL